MKSFSCVLLVLPFLAAHAMAAAPAGNPGAHMPDGFVIRVPQDAPTIQLGIDVASNGDTILIAEGNYFENINFRGKHIVVTSLAIRDGDTSHIRHTVIDGGTPSSPDTGSVVSFVSQEDTNAVLYGLTLQHGSGTRFGSIFPPFMTGARVGGGIFIYESGPRILRCVIQSNATAGDTAVGAGIYALAYNRKPHIVIDACTIRNNSVVAGDQAWGGGASMHGMRGRIIGTLIEHNTVAGHGSALGGGLDIWRYRPDTVTTGLCLFGNRIRGNSAVAYDGAWGGGVISTEGSFLMTGNTIDSNLVRDTLSGAFSGGVHIEDGGLTGPPVIARGNSIAANRVESNAVAYGGGMTIHTDDAVLAGMEFRGNALAAPEANGSALARLYGTSATVVDSSLFTNNNGEATIVRGSIYVGQSPGILLSRLHVEGNSGTEGGGVHINTSGFRLENCLIRNNGATTGGGVFVQGSPPVHMVGDARARSPRIRHVPPLEPAHQATVPPPDRQEIINCTIVENAALTQGGGLHAATASPVVLNSIFWNDTAGTAGSEISVNNANVQVRYSDVRLGWPGSGNIDADPRLSGAAAHLDTASSCIGAGIDTMLISGEWYYAPVQDREGGIRPNPPGTLPDIGAFESALSLPGGVVRTFAVTRGWGLVSVPLTMADYHKSVVFPTASSEAWAYHGTYVVRSILDNRVAYWLKFDSAHTIAMTGLVRSLDTVRVDSGWNLIGSISSPVDTGSIVKVPAGFLRSSFFGYSRSGYRIVGTIEPMNGYWVRAAVPGMLILSSSAPPVPATPSMLSDLGSVTITDATGAQQRLWYGPGFDESAYALPPPPPGGTMDARFASGSLVCAGDQEIRLNGGVYPLQVEIIEGARSSACVAIDGVTRAEPGRAAVVTGPGHRILLRIGIPAQGPAAFGIFQNYPNPFNAGSTIVFAVPGDRSGTGETRLASVKVFDLLGRMVATLVDGPMAPGVHTVRFDASDLASGVYVARLEASGMASTRRLMVLK